VPNKQEEKFRAAQRGWQHLSDNPQLHDKAIQHANIARFSSQETLLVLQSVQRIQMGKHKALKTKEEEFENFEDDNDDLVLGPYHTSLQEQDGLSQLQEDDEQREYQSGLQ
jgi:hypothetical protein